MLLVSDTRSDGPARGCMQDVSASMVLQKFAATSYRNGLKIKFNHAENQPVAATASYSETERCVKPVIFLV